MVYLGSDSTVFKKFKNGLIQGKSRKMDQSSAQESVFLLKSREEVMDNDGQRFE